MYWLYLLFWAALWSSWYRDGHSHPMSSPLIQLTVYGHSHQVYSPPTQSTVRVTLVVVVVWPLVHYHGDIRMLGQDNLIREIPLYVDRPVESVLQERPLILAANSHSASRPQLPWSNCRSIPSQVHALVISSSCSYDFMKVSICNVKGF